jgi:replicative DNA helicase
VIPSVQQESGSIADLKKPRRRGLPNVDLSKLDRLPPASIEAEQGVLGCLLLDLRNSMDKLAEREFCKEHFYDLRHQTIFETMVDLWADQNPGDLIIVQQALRDAGSLESVGGIAYLSELMDGVPSAANLEYYAGIVEEKAWLRQLLQGCTGIISRIYETEGDVEAFMDEMEVEFLRIFQRPKSTLQFDVRRPLGSAIHRAINTIEDWHARKGAVTGLSTGFPDVDKATTGLHGGEMIVLAARPSMGKTSLAMNIAVHVALDQKQPVGVFSLEMTTDQLALRLLCSEAWVNLRNIREGFLADRDFPKLTGAAGRLVPAPVFIDDTSFLTIMQLRAKARRMVQMYGVKLFVIDYLQLLKAVSKSSKRSRQEEVSEVSNGIKSLAKELDVPIIVLAQLNREAEKERRRPRLSDLRESGALEQDADLVGLLYDPSKIGKDEEDEAEIDGSPVNLLIAKQRNGPLGTIALTFLKNFTRFESAAKVADCEEEVPL